MKRDSRFELLRIMSMFLIVIFHLEFNSQVWRTGTVNTYPNALYLASYLSLGKLGVYLFVMITGYFIGNKMYPISKGIGKAFVIWCETLSYAVLVFLACLALNLISFSWHSLLVSFFPFLTDQYWFVDAYIVLMLLVPFINMVLQNLSRLQFLYLIVIVSILASLLSPINSLIFSSELQFGYLLPPYLIGAFIKKEQLRVNHPGIKFILVYLATITIASLFYYFNFSKYINIMYFGIFQLIMALYLFITFQSWSSFHYNKVINVMASTVFATYLITDNSLFKPILWGNHFFYNSNLGLVNIVGIGITVVLLLGCGVIDLGREFLFAKLQIPKMGVKITNKIDSLLKEAGNNDK